MGLSGFIHRNIHVDSPYEINRASDELHYTYLDTFGRPVIVAHKSNLVEQHIQDIVVSVASLHGLPEQLRLLSVQWHSQNTHIGFQKYILAGLHGQFRCCLS